MQANKSAKSSKAKTAETVTFGTGNLVANITAPIGVQTNNGVPVQFTAPQNSMAAMAQTIMAETAKPVTTGRNVGFVQFINGWPNGVPVPNMQPFMQNGALFSGQIAHTNPVAKCFTSGKAQSVQVPNHAKQNLIVKLGKCSKGAGCPVPSSNASNTAIGTAVNTYLTQHATCTLLQLAQHCAETCGAHNVPNIWPYLVTYSLKQGYITLA
jgi:hypothetical protein